MAENDYKIILASRSIARRNMLQNAGLIFESEPADLDEDSITRELLEAGTDIEKIAEELAGRKALHVSGNHPQALVIGSDQTLDFDGKLLSKAKSPEEAKEKLKALRGKTHRLISAASVAQGDKTLWGESECAELTMRDFDDAFLDDYIKVAGEALTQSVGAYEIENEGAKLFSDVEGDTHTILGLPLEKLLDYLQEEHGIAP